MAFGRWFGTRRQAFKATAALAGGLATGAASGAPAGYGWEVVAEGSRGPGPRSRHGLAHDRAAGATVLFGGIIWDADGDGVCQSDTWQLRDRRWKRVRLMTAPAARHRTAMAYLAGPEFSLLFGGQASDNEFLGDTWAYAAGRWRRLSPAGRTPPPRCGHALASDEGAGVAVLFGGVGAGNASLGDTWTFDGAKWKRAAARPSPLALRYAALCYDPTLKGCVLHGGSDDESGKTTVGTAWLFRSGAWSELGADWATDPRDDHGLGYDAPAGRLVMLEGTLGGRGLLRRGGAAWEPLAADPLHPRHQCSPVVYDEPLGGLLLHGGEARHGGPQFDATLLLRARAAP